MSGTLKVTQVKLGDSADQTKNFQITVPAVPDGTLKITKGDGSLFGNYANDAAAAAGGVPVGGIYRNGSVLMVRTA